MHASLDWCQAPKRNKRILTPKKSCFQVFAGLVFTTSEMVTGTEGSAADNQVGEKCLDTNVGSFDLIVTFHGKPADFTLGIGD